MKLHSKAWGDIDILIFGERAMLPMRIEQQIVSQAPHLESHIESFENYSDAYEFCKETKNVGLLFIIDTGVSILADQIQELSKHFTGRMPICPYVLISEETSSFITGRTIAQCPNIIDVVKPSEFEDVTKLNSLLVEGWDRYLRLFEEEFFQGDMVKRLITNDSIKSLGEDKHEFCSRNLYLLSSSLNLNWIEQLRCNWSFFLRRYSGLKELQKANSSISILINEFKNTYSDLDIISLNKKKDIPLTCRVELTIDIMLSAIEKGELSMLLDDIDNQTKISSPAILRNIKKNKLSILKSSTQQTLLKVA